MFPRPSSLPGAVAAVGLAFLSTFTPAHAAELDCSKIRVDKVNFDLSKLGGPHSILVQDTQTHPAVSNTTWTIDVCSNLKKPKGSGGAKEDYCPNYTRVCGVTKSYNPFDDPDGKNGMITAVIPVAGSFHLSGHGGYLEPTFTRLKTTDSKSEGLTVELHGGRFDGRKQKAVVTFLCDHDKSGDEKSKVEQQQQRRDEDDKDKGSDSDGDNNNDDDDDDDDPDRFKQDPDSALQFISYGPVETKEGLVDILKLDWRTKYACEKRDSGSDNDEDEDDDDKKSTSSGWGFFTWFILILFLGIAAYLIFGSWLNYNRYGARGWDLLPHGDTIRDIPYLFKDWSRKVVDTVTGGHSRGGYSAV